MTNEQLTHNRYKVISDYPHSPFEVHTVLHVDIEGYLYSKENGYVKSNFIVREEQASKLTSIFRRLQWYEFRKEVDVPEYLIVVAETVNYRRFKGVVIKTGVDVFWNSNTFSFNKDGFINAYGGILIHLFEPATEKQYLEYKSAKNIN